MRKVAELEVQVQNVKAEKRRMKRRDKEIIFVTVVGACIVMYACIALVIRGFV